MRARGRRGSSSQHLRPWKRMSGRRRLGRSGEQRRGGGRRGGAQAAAGPSLRAAGARAKRPSATQVGCFAALMLCGPARISYRCAVTGMPLCWCTHVKGQDPHAPRTRACSCYG